MSCPIQGPIANLLRLGMSLILVAFSLLLALDEISWAAHYQPMLHVMTAHAFAPCPW
jgi:hypothetical protein